MSGTWRYQIRVYLTDAATDMARGVGAAAALRPLTEVLARHEARLVSQFDAFSDYVAEAEANGPENFPLYKWTKATLEDPEKRAKHMRAFAVRVQDQEVYGKDAADALEAELQKLVGCGLVTGLTRHDTNPANNLAVPAAYRG